MKKILIAAISALFLWSCSKDDSPASEKTTTPGFYVLSEGSWGQENTMLGYYDFAAKRYTPDIYEEVNGEKLGDTGNDMLKYGNKLYIVMNVTGNVTVADAATAKKIKTISFKTDGINKEPRYAIGYRNKIYISNYDATVSVIDTSSLEVIKNITVGEKSEGLAIAGNKLFVANSGFGAGNTVSVIDLDKEEVTATIEVGLNPFKVIAAKDKILVTHRSVWGNNDYLPQTYVINAVTARVSHKLAVEDSRDGIAISKNRVFTYSSGSNIIGFYNDGMERIRENFITDGTVPATPYGINADGDNGYVFIADAVNYSGGKVFMFDYNGAKLLELPTAPGTNPNKVVVR